MREGLSVSVCRHWHQTLCKLLQLETLAERSDPKVMSVHKELSVKSRVRGDFHARFCERVRLKLPRSTRPMILLNTEARRHGVYIL